MIWHACPTCKILVWIGIENWHLLPVGGNLTMGGPFWHPPPKQYKLLAIHIGVFDEISFIPFIFKIVLCTTFSLSKQGTCILQLIDRFREKYLVFIKWKLRKKEWILVKSWWLEYFNKSEMYVHFWSSAEKHN